MKFYIYTYSFLEYMEYKFKNEKCTVSDYYDKEHGIRYDFEKYVEESFQEFINEDNLILKTFNVSVSITDKDVFYHTVATFK